MDNKLVFSCDEFAHLCNLQQKWRLTNYSTGIISIITNLKFSIDNKSVSYFVEDRWVGFGFGDIESMKFEECPFKLAFDIPYHSCIITEYNE